jgi:hypothetical protein
VARFHSFPLVRASSERVDMLALETELDLGEREASEQ